MVIDGDDWEPPEFTSATCRPVTLGSGETVAVLGDEPMSPEDVAALAELVDAVQRLHAELHPADPGAEELYERLDAAKRTHGLLPWRALAVDAGVPASMLSRLANGRMPGAEDLAKIETWLAANEAQSTVTATETRTP